MLKDWSVSNFKSIATTRVINEDGEINDKIDLKPLTIFCGANSSGKSSLLQSLLLVAQTMRHQNKKYPLILNGAFTNLGRFCDIKTEPSDCDEVKIRFTYTPLGKYEFFKNKYPYNNENVYEPGKPEYIEDASFLLDFIQDFKQNKKDILPTLSKFELLIHYSSHTLEYYSQKQDEKLTKYFYITEIGPNNNEVEINRILRGENCKWNHFIPENITINGKHIFAMALLRDICSLAPLTGDIEFIIPDVAFPDEMSELAKYLQLKFGDSEWENNYAPEIKKSIINYLKDNLLSGIQGIDNLFNHKDSNWKKTFFDLPIAVQKEIINKIKCDINFIYENISKELSRIENNLRKDFIKYNELFFRDFIASENIENYLSEISDYFSSKISYLGPLREDPKPLYPISETSYTYDIGKKGENTAAILALSGEDKNEFPVPDYENYGTYKKEKKTIKEAVIDWLKYIGVVEDIVVELKQGGFTLKIKTPGSNHFSHLTNVGVGVSQVIPIVTMCLSAVESSTLIIEQPELHLHPKMQTKLTDFFVAITQSGRQCIIETHSEHIINALRYRVAKASSPEDEKLANDIQIYFVEKDEKGTLFKSITMDKYAYISEWPEDFFDEAQITNINTLKAINKKIKEEPPSE